MVSTSSRILGSNVLHVVAHIVGYMALYALVIACASQHSICQDNVQRMYRIAVYSAVKANVPKAVLGELKTVVQQEITDVQSDLKLARTQSQEMHDRLLRGDTALLELERDRVRNDSLTFQEAVINATVAMEEIKELQKGVLSRKKMNPAVSIFCERLAALESYMIMETITRDIGMPIDPLPAFKPTHTIRLSKFELTRSKGRYTCTVGLVLRDKNKIILDTIIAGADTSVHEALECRNGTPECAINACVAGLLNPLYIAITDRKDAFIKP